MSDSMVALITGANKGIGYEIAAQLAVLGHSVLVGARNPELGEEAAAKLRASGADATSVVLDVTDRASIAAAAREVDARYGRLDALVNNAGISRPPGTDWSDQVPSSADVDAIRYMFDTNFFGVVDVISAMLPLLHRSKTPRIVNLSSYVGSLARMSDPERQPKTILVGYNSSKAALNALTIQYARDLRPAGILVNAVCPGFVATDLNDFTGVRTPAQGAAAAVRMATIPADGPTGTFTDDEGTVPW